MGAVFSRKTSASWGTDLSEKTQYKDRLASVIIKSVVRTGHSGKGVSRWFLPQDGAKSQNDSTRG